MERSSTPHAVDDPTKTYVSSAAALAQNLRTEVGSLPGCHFSCRVVPGNPGTFFVDFQMTPEPGTDYDRR
ncbi:hypothetical protein OG824_07365 [Streptomyces prunicolor]|uniref:hypothetical protein n=1 Tax=Streptomyces prunicolor TaxID=67348 RepID=UPI0022554343|nr:hypothetical protein [Streptomyces prunicolor]MCX5235045.1 hypothetical protein [Streptomyces prunicolor]